MKNQDDRSDLLDQAEAALAAQDFHAALAAATEAVQIARITEDRALDVPGALRLKALSLTGLGRVDEAQAAWAEAKYDYEALGSAEGAAECDAHLKR